MKTLLEAMRTRIAEQVLYLGGEKAVHFVPDRFALPETTPFPCVGLKDGAVMQHYYLGAARQKAELNVEIICYVQIFEYGAAIIGKGTEKGILDVLYDVRTALEWWAPADYRWVNGDVSEDASQAINVMNEAGETQKLIQVKGFTMKWLKG